MTGLKQLADTRTSLGRKRKEEARHYYVLGIHCLELARKRGFQDKKILKQCCELFAESIRRDRESPEAFIKLAYLLAMMQIWNKALPYLHQALRLAPGHGEAKALMAFIQSRTCPAPARVEAESFCLLDF